MTTSFKGFVEIPGDDTNSGDGPIGSGTGIGTYSSTLDLVNFDNIYRTWSKLNNSVSGFDTLQRGPGIPDSALKIWDSSLASSESVLLNKSGNGTNINHGATLSIDGSVTPPNNSFTAGATCPVQVLGNRNVESRPYAYNITNYPSGTTGYQSAGSGVTCNSGDSNCVKRFLINASEIMDDTIGNDDGLCEDYEDCTYNPNFGAYQGHFETNEANPTINHSSHECIWSANSGTAIDVRVYGYPKNGR